MMIKLDDTKHNVPSNKTYLGKTDNVLAKIIPYHRIRIIHENISRLTKNLYENSKFSSPMLIN